MKYHNLSEVLKARHHGKLLFSGGTVLHFWDDYSEIVDEKGEKVFQGYGTESLLKQALDLLEIPWIYGDQKRVK